MLPDARTYAALYRDFRWQIPARYNIGTDVCTRWALADPTRPAIIWQRLDGQVETVSFGRLEEESNRLANVLAACGIRRGDRVAIILSQGPAAAIAHIAIYKTGAIAVPLAALFGPDALAFRLANSGARALLTNAEGVAKLADIRDGLGELSVVLSVDGRADGVDSLADAMDKA